ncbi:hypothetical protein BWQ96_04257 [Gracilariopsis chorda]|uniref:Beta-1,3-glucanase N-terminal domain-containing protein n=1 Tax=Gracilariopsis chorda TaxID=448386 RepID=A0A2V3IV54_9FLOR|nr:hypothetical protein BWQ96_04257 [Gracilariopsis chorda]|eukprot:PXF46001.1 hypothetical protein BWQ96_04257 [Gracilariopsis chorda]
MAFHGKSFLFVVLILIIDVWAIDDELVPAPPSIGADVPLALFGPAPSQVDPRLLGPVQLLKSGDIDFDAGTMTLPLYRGTYSDDTTHWYVLTDSTDESNANALGLNFASKLEFVTPDSSSQAILSANGLITKRSGKVDFSPRAKLVPGRSIPYPPSRAAPPQVGDDQYSPYVRLSNAGNRLYNAPIIAGSVSESRLERYCDGVPGDDRSAKRILHSKVRAICPSKGTVTLTLASGFSFAKPVFYLTLDASAAIPAALEDATLAPRISSLRLGADDSAFSPAERLYVVINGYTNSDLPPGAPSGQRVHPSRQGINSFLAGEGSPFHVLSGIPTVALDYSPAWDWDVGEWTRYSVRAGIRERLLDEFQTLGFVQRGYFTGPNGKAFGSSGFVVNGPIVYRFL